MVRHNLENFSPSLRIAEMMAKEDKSRVECLQRCIDRTQTTSSSPHPHGLLYQETGRQRLGTDGWDGFSHIHPMRPHVCYLCYVTPRWSDPASVGTEISASKIYSHVISKTEKRKEN